ncbi:glycosyltransferase family 2 protein [Microlunatus ginsengisoli]|uniref:Glycosyltransferase family 2 protein n=1 Tax=Microlunatus ginsengisoli TaxID=363863 RepID=A0ABP7AJC1_9ACTN
MRIQERQLNVAIVTYNSEQYIEALLESLPAAAGQLVLRTVLVDNGSIDATVEVAKRFPVDVIETGVNLGYSGGINVARQRLGPGNLAILNPDLTLERASLEILVAALEGSVGIVAPRVIDEEGTLFTHLRREPTVLNAIGESLFGARFPRRPAALADTIREPASYSVPQTVDWAGAPAWVVSSACDQAVGAWDSETYFLYSEETDYARRARDAGFTVLYEPAATVVHHGGGSGFSDWQLALMSRNRIRYFDRFSRRAASKLAFRVAVVAGHGLRAVSPAHRAAARSIVLGRPVGSRSLPPWAIKNESGASR